MRFKKAKPVVWSDTRDAVVGENGILANGLRVRSELKAGASCDIQTEYRDIPNPSNEGKTITQVQDCLVCDDGTPPSCSEWYTP